MTGKELILNFLKRNSKLSLIVTIIMALIILLLVTIFPNMPADNAVNVSNSWPQIMKDLFGDPVYGFTDIYGWLYLQIFHITYWLAFGLLGAILAAHIVAKEVEENTIDILLSYPITRSSLVISRIITVTIIMIIVTIGMIFICAVGILIAGYPVYMILIIQVSLAGFLLSMIFVSISLFISIWAFQQTLSVFFTLGVMGFFFMYEEVLVKLHPFLDKLSFFNPFHYYQPGEILIHKSFSIRNSICMLAYFLFFFILSLLFFNRRDITQ
ncbi:MAG: ABC transporter permease subunit [Spirochaetales bacterium]|nr:ABC transporter permease subunit [Spirochaetales bacterium]